MKTIKQNKKQLTNKKGMVAKIVRYFVWTIFSLFILLILLVVWLLPSLNLKH